MKQNGADDEEHTNSGSGSRPCILIEGPSWGDAEFYGRWLLAAAQAEAFWKETQQDIEFQQRVEAVAVVYLLDFGRTASLMITQLKEYGSTFIIDLDSEEADDFAMMLMMGFFEPYNGRYRMVVPTALALVKVKDAIIKYAETEREDGLHPEYLVSLMSFAEAKTWQQRIFAIHQFRSYQHTLGHA